MKASNTRVGHAFGIDVSLDGDTLAVGAAKKVAVRPGSMAINPITAVINAGAVYVYTRTAGVWTQQAYVKASNTNMGNPFGSGDIFGITVALNGDTLVVGAWGEASCASGIDGNQLDNGCGASGAVYIFARTNTRWSQVAYVKPIRACRPASQTVWAVAGVRRHDTRRRVGWTKPAREGSIRPQAQTIVPQSGAVYLFSRTATSWAQRAFVKASNTEAWDRFGTSGLAIAGNTLAVGATHEDSCATGINGTKMITVVASFLFISVRAPGSVQRRLRCGVCVLVAVRATDVPETFLWLNCGRTIVASL